MLLYRGVFARRYGRPCRPFGGTGALRIEPTVKTTMLFAKEELSLSLGGAERRGKHDNPSIAGAAQQTSHRTCKR
jgi:hypothetical protein